MLGKFAIVIVGFIFDFEQSMLNRCHWLRCFCGFILVQAIVGRTILGVTSQKRE